MLGGVEFASPKIALYRMNSRLAHLAKLADENPDDPFPPYATALEYSASGNHQSALEILLDLSHKHPDYLPLYFIAGQEAEKLGKSEDASRMYQRGIELARSVGDAKTLRELRGALDLLDDE